MSDHQKIIKQIEESSDFRKSLTKKSFSWFFATYFSHFITCPTAEFQKEIFDLLQKEDELKIAITAFRGSAKSTLATLAFPIWAMVGNPSKKYTLLISQTQELSKQILTNIKQELSTNELLIKDFGPFSSDADEWRSNSLVIKKYNSRLSAISQSEKIRGLRHRQYRPDNIIIDDVEDLESVKTKENRDKLWDWFTGEIMPIGDIGTKMVIVGNLLHEDSLMMRLKESIKSGKMTGKYLEYPLINEKGEIAWLGKYPSFKDIELKRKAVADDQAWHREYLLKFISDDMRIIQRDWPKYWTKLPDLMQFPPRIVGIGTDLAISEKSSADYTSLVPFIVIGFGDNLEIYILPYIVNKRMSFPNTIIEIKKMCVYLKNKFSREPIVYVENVGYQTALAQQLGVEKINSEAVNISRMNKSTRLEISAPYIKMGKMLFPKNEAEELISQIVNFGIEKHDDLADALTTIVLKTLETDRATYESTKSTRSTVRYERDPISEEYRDLSKPITAGFMDMQF